MEEVLVIETTREAYSIEQLYAPMTVKELMDILSNYDENEKVVLSNDGGYTYGNIYERNFSETEIEVEEEC